MVLTVLFIYYFRHGRLLLGLKFRLNITGYNYSNIITEIKTSHVKWFSYCFCYNSPLGHISDLVSVSKENAGPDQYENHRSRNDLDYMKRNSRGDLVKLVCQGSSHGDLAATNEISAERLLLSRLEYRENIEQKLLKQHEQECKIVSCSTVCLLRIATPSHILNLWSVIFRRHRLDIQIHGNQYKFILATSHQ